MILRIFDFSDLLGIWFFFLSFAATLVFFQYLHFLGRTVFLLLFCFVPVCFLHSSHFVFCHLWFFFFLIDFVVYHFHSSFFNFATNGIGFYKNKKRHLIAYQNILQKELSRRNSYPLFMREFLNVFFFLCKMLIILVFVSDEFEEEMRLSCIWSIVKTNEHSQMREDLSEWHLCKQHIFFMIDTNPVL